MNIVDNDELTFTGGGTIADNISGPGHVSFQGYGAAWYITGNLTQTGGTTLYEGAILVGGNGSGGGSTGSITGDIVLGVASDCTLAFNRSNAYIYNGNISGHGEVDQDGPGTLTLTGTNTYSGRTYILQGVLEVYGDVNLGSGPIGIGGGTLRFLSSTTSALHYDVTGNDSQGAFDTDGFDVTLSGTVATPNGVNVAGGFGGFSKLGLGTLTLTGADTYLGSTFIRAGTLQIGNGGTTGSLGAGAVTDNASLVFDRSDNITIANVISGTGTLTQLGNGILTLTGSNTYTGETDINAGILALSGTGSIAASSAVVDNALFDISQKTSDVSIISLGGNGIVALGGRTLNITGGTGDLSTGAFSGVIQGGTGGRLVIGGGYQALTGDNTYSGGTTIASGASLYVGLNTATGSLGSGSVQDNGFLVYLRTAATTLANVISGTGELDQLGSGALTITTADSYTGRTAIDTGTTLALSGAGSVASSSYIGNYDGIFDISGTTSGASIKALSDLGSSVAAVELGGKTLTISAGAGYIFSGTIVDGGIAGGTGGGLTIAAGVQFLTGQNIYTGTTTIASGAHLVLGNNTGAGSLGSGNVVNNGNLDFNRGDTDTITNVISGTGALNIVSGTLALTGANSYGQTNINAGTALNIGNGGTTGTLGTGAVSNLSALTFNRSNDFTIGNDISGNGNVFKVNTGTTTLTGTNSYSGITVISGGVLAVGNGGTTGSLGSGDVSVNDGATLTINRSNTVTLSNAIGSGTNGTLVQAGSGTTILTGANTLNGSTTISAGTLQIGNGGTSGSLGSSAVTDNGTLTFNRNDSVTLANVISGTGALTQAGSGILILTANNTYTGTTTIASGAKLAVGNNTATGSLGSGAIINDGTLYFGHTGTATVANVISGRGSLQQFSGGNTILTGTNTYTGATIIFGGTLSVDGSIAPASMVSVANEGTLGGTGTVGVTTIGPSGTLAPGDGIGTLHVNGDLTLASSATFAEQISPSTADEVMVSGRAGIAGTLTADFAGGSYGHRTFTILHASDDLSGTFANISTTGLPAGLEAYVTYDAHNVYLTTDHAAAVTTANLTELHNQTLAASSLFTVSDADNDTITRYQLWDSSSDPGSGHFVVSGVAQAARTVIDITAAQLAQTSFVTGATSDTLQIRAFDGTAWSAADSAQWSPFTVSISANNPPVVTTSNVAAQRNQTLAASSLFTVSDADSDTITRYQLWDGSGDPNSGHFVVGGVAQAAGTVIDITAAQLAQTAFVTGTAAPDRLQTRAFDGTAWSAADSAQWSPFTVTVPINHAPVVTTSNVAAQRNQTLAASSLFTVSDADSDTITKYQLWDGSPDAASGHFVVGGVTQAPRTLIEISAAQLAQTSFVTGSGAPDTLQIRAFDGTAWSAADSAQWSPFTVSLPANRAPVVTTSAVNAGRGQTLAVSSLFTVSDANSDTITKYQLWDGSPDAASGYFVVGGVAQAPRTPIEITAAQLSQTSFVTGTAAPDTLQIRAFDGTAWSAADSAQWSPFTVTVPINHAPVVTTSNVAAQKNQTLALSSLFTVSDADSDTITRYQLWDGSPDAASGHFVVGGVAQAPRTLIEITAAQLAQTSFVTGTAAPDTLQIRAFDGTAWSAADSAQWSPFTVSLPPNNPPVVTTADVTAQASHTLTASSLFTVSDADGDAITEYQFWDSTPNASSGHFVVNGAAVAAQTVIDIPSSQLGQVSFLTGGTGDMLQVRAFDGKSWSAPDSAQWSPFHVAVS